MSTMFEDADNFNPYRCGINQWNFSNVKHVYHMFGKYKEKSNPGINDFLWNIMRVKNIKCI